jgi:hypothetical protein
VFLADDKMKGKHGGAGEPRASRLAVHVPDAFGRRQWPAIENNFLALTFYLENLPLIQDNPLDTDMTEIHDQFDTILILDFGSQVRLVSSPWVFHILTSLVCLV